MSKLIGFVQKHLCERGTTTAMYDYACANEEEGNVSIIFYDPTHRSNNVEVVEKFQSRFTVLEFSSLNDIENFIDYLSIEYLYIIKYGNNDGFITKKIPCLIHSVFSYHPHGNYACVSKKVADDNNGVWLPHIINPLPSTKGECRELRTRFNIPKDAYVYGRYGGKDTFSIEYTKEVIREDIDKHPNVWFIFVNTDVFIHHPRVLFLPAIINPIDKGNFINNCDAMIHGRREGETFGLAIAEFISLGKPVLSCMATCGNDNEHIALGKEWVTLYENKEDFREKVWKRVEVPPTANPYLVFSPKNVMRKFYDILGI